MVRQCMSEIQVINAIEKIEKKITLVLSQIKEK